MDDGHDILPVLDELPSRQAFELALVLFLSFLIGLEREEHKARASHYVFGGIRTFPLIGFVGYGLARLSGGNVLALAIGFVVVGGLMWISYWHKVHADSAAGATTEVSGLLTYLVGALVHVGAYWTAVALGVIAVLLLELREALERLTTRIARDEVLALTKFLLLAIVILPVLPDRGFTRFAINPFDAWLAIVAVSGLSYGSYALQRWLEQRGGVLVTALLGGAYSSTATTIVLAREGKTATLPRLYAGSTLAASGVMYLRILVLVALFKPALARVIGPWFGVLAVVAIAPGAMLARSGSAKVADAPSKPPPARNPLELRPAFVFGVAFVATLVATRLALEHVGRGGLFALAALMGFGDVDPFVLGLARSSGSGDALHLVGAAIITAAAANNLAKAAYARAFGGNATGTLSLLLLAGLAAIGLLPLLWV